MITKKISVIFLFLTVAALVSCTKRTETINNNYPKNFDFTAVDSFFKEYVKDGKVDYKRVKDDNALAPYIEQVKNFEPYGIEDDTERLAFWINAYNAFTIKLITNYYPVNSIMDIHGKAGQNPWDIEFIEMAGGRKFSLDEIEKEIIIPEFKEARIHYVLVCAAESCPPIIAEAYLPGNLHQLMDRQAERFLNNKNFNYLDKEDDELYLSMIFSWYGRDFRKSDGSVLSHVLKYLNNEDKNYIKEKDVDDISFLDYNWELNGFKEESTDESSTKKLNEEN